MSAFPVLRPLGVLCLGALMSGLLATVPARADEAQCKYTAPRQISVDAGSAKAIVFEVASHNLTLIARPGKASTLQGRACASNEKWLPQLTVTQRREGDKLIVQLRRESSINNLFGGNQYAYLELSGSVPDHLPVQVKVGSGDVKVSGAAIVSVDVGSGDASVRDTRGLVAFTVGSGDVEIQGAGSLQGISIGSGDAKARQIRGPVRIGNIGSGDFELSDAQRPVEIASIGSGDADLSRIDGNVRIGSIGSGSVEVRQVRGDLSVPSIGSGEIRHSDIRGRISLPRGH